MKKSERVCEVDDVEATGEDVEGSDRNVTICIRDAHVLSSLLPILSSHTLSSSYLFPPLPLPSTPLLTYLYLTITSPIILLFSFLPHCHCHSVLAV